MPTCSRVIHGAGCMYNMVIMLYAWGMENSRKSSHTVYDIKYDLLWITKYRKAVLRGEVAELLRDSIREICKASEVEIIKGHVSQDHVHIFVSVPRHISVSQSVHKVDQG
jgi:putative transposase